MAIAGPGAAHVYFHDRKKTAGRLQASAINLSWLDDNR